MAVTVRDVALDLRLIAATDAALEAAVEAVLARHLGASQAFIMERAPDAPEALADAAVVAMAAYMFDRPSAPSGGRFASAWTNSGAASMLARYVRRRARAIGVAGAAATGGGVLPGPAPGPSGPGVDAAARAMAARAEAAAAANAVSVAELQTEAAALARSIAGNSAALLEVPDLQSVSVATAASYNLTVNAQLGSAKPLALVTMAAVNGNRPSEHGGAAFAFPAGQVLWFPPASQDGEPLFVLPQGGGGGGDLRAYRTAAAQDIIDGRATAGILLARQEAAAADAKATAAQERTPAGLPDAPAAEAEAKTYALGRPASTADDNAAEWTPVTLGGALKIERIATHPAGMIGQSKFLRTRIPDPDTDFFVRVGTVPGSIGLPETFALVPLLDWQRVPEIAVDDRSIFPDATVENTIRVGGPTAFRIGRLRVPNPDPLGSGSITVIGVSPQVGNARGSEVPTPEVQVGFPVIRGLAAPASAADAQAIAAERDARTRADEALGRRIDGLEGNASPRLDPDYWVKTDTARTFLVHLDPAAVSLAGVNRVRLDVAGVRKTVAVVALQDTYELAFTAQDAATIHRSLRGGVDTVRADVQLLDAADTFVRDWRGFLRVLDSAPATGGGAALPPVPAAPGATVQADLVATARNIGGWISFLMRSDDIELTLPAALGAEGDRVFVHVATTSLANTFYFQQAGADSGTTIVDMTGRYKPGTRVARLDMPGAQIGLFTAIKTGTEWVIYRGMFG